MNDMQITKPTAEQQMAIDLFETGKSLKINAYAGTGKTATLMMLSETTDRYGTYLAFNRSLADEARSKFPGNVTCRTTHQLAYHSTPDVYRRNRNKIFGTVNANYVARKCNLKGLDIDLKIRLSPRLLGSIVLQTVRKYQHSANLEITHDHVPCWGKIGELSENALTVFKNAAVQYAQRLWDSMLDPGDKTPLGHDGYYKAWAVSDPIIPGNFIFVDECQDTNPVMLGVLKRQQAQMIYVGDRYQQIYDWRGAVNAMENVTTDHASALTLSFRFGPAIADAAGKLLSELGEKVMLRGNPEINSKLGCCTPDAILCRTNAGAIEHLLKALAEGQKPFVIGGDGELIRLLRGVISLKSGTPVDIPEFFGFSDWSEVVDFSDSDEGAHLQAFTRLVERFGAKYILDTLSEMNSSERDASVVISTVHRAKGRQWARVKINDDFPVMSKIGIRRDQVNNSEIRLLYTGMTRAQREVQLPRSLIERFGLEK